MLKIIPEPREISLLPVPACRLERGFSIICQPEDRELRELAAVFLPEGDQLGGNASPPSAGLVLKVDPAVGDIHAEAYVLVAGEAGVEISAASRQGLRHGLATLVQLAEGGSEGGVRIPALIIKDFPALEWRGMHLDCARYYKPMEFLRKFIDSLFRYKFNRLHLHLTDDQGWRIEIKSLPKLTEIGAWRRRTLKGHGKDEPWPLEYDDVRHGGFYTQQELREFIRFASTRGVEVVPEIDMPGHATAAIAAYPEFGCVDRPVEVAAKWGIFRHVLNVGSDQTLQAVRGIIDEVAEIFPSPYFHLGGDECPTTYWERNAACLARMRSEGLRSARELHGWFMRQMGDHAVSRGKTPIAWDDVLESGLDLSPFVIAAWRGGTQTEDAIRKGYRVINCNWSTLYFDHYQTEDPSKEPLSFGGFSSLEKVLSFDPVPAGLERADLTRVLGAQGHLWSEYLPTPDRVEYAAFPRILALSEVLWRGKKLAAGPEFVGKVRKELDLLEQRGVRSCRLGV